MVRPSARPRRAAASGRDRRDGPRHEGHRRSRSAATDARASRSLEGRRPRRAGARTAPRGASRRQQPRVGDRRERSARVARADARGDGAGRRLGLLVVRRLPRRERRRGRRATRRVGLGDGGDRRARRVRSGAIRRRLDRVVPRLSPRPGLASRTSRVPSDCSPAALREDDIQTELITSGWLARCAFAAGRPAAALRLVEAVLPGRGVRSGRPQTSRWSGGSRSTPAGSTSRGRCSSWSNVASAASLDHDLSSLRAGIAALEGRTPDALALYRSALAGYRDAGCRFDVGPDDPGHGGPHRAGRARRPVGDPGRPRDPRWPRRPAAHRAARSTGAQGGPPATASAAAAEDAASRVEAMPE